MEEAGLKRPDRSVEGVVEMMLDATRNYNEPLTVERLFAWHASLFPTGRSNMRRIRAGMWRDDGVGPMNVVSGPAGRKRIHFQAPAAAKIEGEMDRFLTWSNHDAESRPEIDPVLKAGVAHLWFVTIHPFDDGNGRIARALADLWLARSENSSQRFYSMSAQIERERKKYYEILEVTQKGGLEITPWLSWFLGCLGRAIDGAEMLLGSVLEKARFWESIGETPLNERQRQIINRLLDGFKGKLTSTKWAKLTKQSQDTAHRDIMDLVEKGILVRGSEGGRSTNYKFAFAGSRQPRNSPALNRTN
jgi:Fic family protein